MQTEVARTSQARPALAVGLALVLGALLLSCGDGGPVQGHGAYEGGHYATDPPPTPGETKPREGEVLEVRPGDTDATVVLSVDLPTAPDQECAEDLRATVESSRMYVWVDTKYDERVDLDCTGRTTRELVVEVPDLTDRRLLVNMTAYDLDPAGVAYATCDPGVGCDPPADKCDPVWINPMLDDMESGHDRRAEILACDGTWMVIDVEAITAGCAPIDGEASGSGCITMGEPAHWFVELQDGAWDLVASGKRAGCAEVHATVPDFPIELCENLPRR